MISTYYALHGFFVSGYAENTSKNVRKAINYIERNVKKDGGWGIKSGDESDCSNTARALTALIESKLYNKESLVIKNGLKYLLDRKSLLKTDTETYVTSGTAGETVFNMNTPFDVLIALIKLDYIGDEIDDISFWFKRIQEDKGCWYISPRDKDSKPIYTWPTSEAIFALDMAQAHYIKNISKIREINGKKHDDLKTQLESEKKKGREKDLQIEELNTQIALGNNSQIELTNQLNAERNKVSERDSTITDLQGKIPKRQRLKFGFLISLIIAQFIYIFQTSYWANLPEQAKQSAIQFWMGIFIGIILGVAANLITPILSKSVEKIRSKF